MPRIPLIENQVSGVTGPPGSGASAEAFGASIGRATSALGGAIQQAGMVGGRLVQIAQEREKQQNVANEVAKTDFTPTYLELQNKSPADGSGFHDAVRERYVNDIEEKALNMDPDAAKAYREKMLARLPSWSAQAAVWQEKQKFSHGKQQADAGLMTLENKVRANPAQYDDARTDGLAVIDARAELGQGQRNAMKTLFQQNMAKGRFEAMGAAATSPEQVDGILSELQSEEWQSRLDPRDFARITTGLEAAKRTISTQQTSQARAALDDLEERTNANVTLDPNELSGINQMVKTSGNPALAWRHAELNMRQTLLRQFPVGTPPDVLQSAAREFRSGRGAGVKTNLPPIINEGIAEATRLTGVSGAFLVSTIGREANHSKMADGDFAFGNDAGASSAKGVGQIIDSTWLSLVKGGGGANAKLMGIDLNQSDEQLLALRDDPKKNIIGVALYAKQNGAVIRNAFGRTATDGELYAAHFLGAGGVVSLISAMQSNPQQSAAALLPQAASANKSVFYRKGEALSVGDLYSRLTGMAFSSPSRMAVSAGEHLEKQADKSRAAMKDNFADYLSTTSKWNIDPVSAASAPDDFVSRGATVRAAAEAYGVPTEDLRPLTKAEVSDMARTVQEGAIEEVAGLMGRLQAMGGPVARAAYKQLGESDPVFEYAAGLAAQGEAPVATEIMKGRRRMTEDKTLKDDTGRRQDLDMAFNKTLGRSLGGLDPRIATQVRDAAMAHYTQTSVAHGTGELGKFDQQAFQKSVDAVLGGRQGAPAIGVVNGHTTLLPRGVTPETMDAAIDNMTTADYVRMSRDGAPPLYKDGSPADPDEIAREGKFFAIGGNAYRIQMADGGFLLTGGKGGMAQVYEFVAEPAVIRDAATRTAPRTPLSQQSEIGARYGRGGNNAGSTSLQERLLGGGQ